MNKNFWSNKSVLITGFEGFLGSHLTRALLTTKAKVIGLDIKTHRKETILSLPDYNKLIVYKGSVANYRLLHKILHKHSVDIILHLAAEALIGASKKNPLVAFGANIQGTWTVLEAARQYGKIGTIIVASSDKAYGSHKRLPYREDTSLMANHPYDVSKSCADLIARTYAHTYNLPVAVTRCGNIFGPGDFNLSRIIPDAIKCALLGRKLFIRSNGKFTRDYVFIDDIVNGYIILAEKLNKCGLTGEAFNFSNESPLTVLEVVKVIAAVSSHKLEYEILNKAKHEIEHQYLKSQKSRDILGWRPKYTFAQGIRKTIQWFQSSSFLNCEIG